MTESTFPDDLLDVIEKHSLEERYGVPKHIILMIMYSSFENYCDVFQTLERFYMQLEEDKRNAAKQASSDELADHILPPNSD